jgi:hypothetical protein
MGDGDDASVKDHAEGDSGEGRNVDTEEAREALPTEEEAEAQADAQAEAQTEAPAQAPAGSEVEAPSQDSPEVPSEPVASKAQQKKAVATPSVGLKRGWDAPTCIICGAAPKYRFPCCKKRYCSLDCFRKHPVSSCSPPEEALKKKRPRQQDEHDLDFENQVPRVILERLRTTPKIQRALASPQLQELIRGIDTSRSRGWALHRHLEQNADFREFVNHLLDTIDFKQ